MNRRADNLCCPLLCTNEKICILAQTNIVEKRDFASKLEHRILNCKTKNMDNTDDK